MKTTDKDVEIKLPPPEIIRFEYYIFPEEDFGDYSADEEYSLPVNKAEEVITPRKRNTYWR